MEIPRTLEKEIYPCGIITDFLYDISQRNQYPEAECIKWVGKSGSNIRMYGPGYPSGNEI